MTTRAAPRLRIPRRPHRRVAGSLAALLTLTVTACSGATAAAPADSASSNRPVGSATGLAPESAAPAAAGFPVSVDSCGRTYTYQQPPARVVLGFPRTLETLDALGVGGSAYGYTLGGYDTLPAGYPAGLVEVSPDYAPAREAMIAAAPDLYLANDDGQVNGEGTVSHDDLAAIGTNVYVLGQYCSSGSAPTSLQAVYDDIGHLGQIYGIPDRAGALQDDLQARVAAAAERVSGQPQRVGFLQAFDGRVYANGGYPASGILDALGMTNEFADLAGSFTEITPEQALVRTPDVLFVLYVGADQEQAAVDGVKAALPNLPAVRADRVYGLDETDFEAGGVTVISALETVTDRIAGGSTG